MMDKIKKQIEAEKTTEQTANTPQDEVVFDKQQVIEDEVRPLTSKLYEIAEKHEFPLFIAVQTYNNGEGAGFAITIHAAKKFGACNTFMKMATDARNLLNGEKSAPGKHDELAMVGALTGLKTASLLKKLDETATPEQKEIINQIVEIQTILAMAFHELA